MAEQNPPNTPQTEEDLFETASAFQRPIFWLALLMVPILFAFTNALFSSSEPAPTPAAIRAPQNRENTQEPSKYHRGAGPGTPSLGREAEETPAATPVVTDCMFDMLIGQSMSAPLYERVKALGRPVFLFEDVGQNPQARDPLRINIFVNPQKTITRVVCG